MKNIGLKFWALLVLTLALGFSVGYALKGSSGEHSHEHEHASNTEYSCSMHPQIRQNEPGDCPLCGMELTPLDENEEMTYDNEIKLSEKALKLANVQTTKVQGGELIKNIALFGKVVPNESKIVSQTAHFPGRIEELYKAVKGENISKGEAIARVFSPQLIGAQKELQEAYSLRDTKPELYQAALARLKSWKISDSEIERMTNSEKPIREITLYADVSGVILTKMLEPGAYIKQGEALYEVSDLSVVWVEFDVFEKDLGYIKLGDEIEISFPAYPNKQIVAKVDFIDRTLNQQNRTVKIRAEIANTNNMLKPEMYANGSLKAKIELDKNQLFVPKSAVLFTGKRSIVYVAQQDRPGVFAMKTVELGSENDDFYTVLSGLSHTDEVVSNGTFTVDAAAQLAGKTSMMNPPAFEVPTDSVEDTFRLKSSEWKTLLPLYMNLKNALVETDVIEARKHLQLLSKAIESVLKNYPDSKAHQHFLSLTKQMAEMKKIEDIRKMYKPFNAHIIASAMQGTGTKLYVQNCPMADNDTGADWLSTEEEIMNPYFGDLMLHCGYVKEELK